MKYNLANSVSLQNFNNEVKQLIDKKAIVELNEIKGKRSDLLNKSLHLWFKFVSDALNDTGLEYRYFGLSGKEFHVKHTENIVKEFLFKPILFAMYGKEKTSKATNKELCDVINEFEKFFVSIGIEVEFPSLESIQKMFEK